MYDDITNINKLRNTVETKRYNQYYEKLCKTITTVLHKHDEKYIEFCKKLVKNYKIFCNTSYKCKNISDYCHDVNNWIYITMKKEKFENWLVQKIYEGIESFAKRQLNKTICPYYSYDTDYREPNKMIFLYMFESNINKMKEILESTDNTLNCYCKEFVKNMVKIYKRMNKDYCINGKDAMKENKKTCSILNTFRTLYTMYLCKEDPIKSILPLLTSDADIEFVKCETNGSIMPSQITSESSHLGSDDQSEPFQDLSDEEIQAIENFDPFTLKVSIKKILPTFLATVAGISSLFFLFYKFTPIRHLLRSKKKVESIKNMHDRDNYKELLYNTVGNDNMYLYNMRYDIAYGNI
ncbi:variable surface protein [Plasmodium gonderi]|uniref:Variable surface protein n=1 Tax=Plasmodium gonderi TaxID=77519 RepID=A0A1Y1JFR6_PLAGO|nr:variable surface protein [Plasmodium gonderi]GAW79592.1 variable surface protein [Plasmodium gonderi]